MKRNFLKSLKKRHTGSKIIR